MVGCFLPPSPQNSALGGCPCRPYQKKPLGTSQFRSCASCEDLKPSRMNLIVFSLIFLLFKSGFSAEEKYLPEGPLDVMLGENITINLLLPKVEGDSIGWGFNNRTIGGLGADRVSIQDPYKDRAIINNNGSLTLKSLKSEDSGNYKLHLFRNGSFFQAKVEVRVKDVLHPNLTLLAPSSEELQQGKLTLTCLGNKGFPSDWRLRWYVNSSSPVNWKEERGPVTPLDDDHYSWSSFLTVDEENWKKISSVTCRAVRGSLAPVSVTLKINLSSETQPDSLD
ncbi:uncharacterized protein LOC103472633 [Poecilia reticulata]|uniref:Uncharacterized LOC103472633 n=1 Tax=Poecilia reticulata TaxID=8081 RepID=A0A3P9PWN1_POERE|nr:PREDICTED: uncharacterized protein LOC103472633 [Poecilia reticulata]